MNASSGYGKHQLKFICLNNLKGQSGKARTLIVSYKKLTDNTKIIQLYLARVSLYSDSTLKLVALDLDNNSGLCCWLITPNPISFLVCIC